MRFDGPVVSNARPRGEVRGSRSVLHPKARPRRSSLVEARGARPRQRCDLQQGFAPESNQAILDHVKRGGTRQRSLTVGGTAAKLLGIDQLKKP
jgi:hypothetical protein